MRKKDKIEFFEVDVKSALKQKRALGAYIIAETHQSYEVDFIRLTYVFCNDAYLLEKNVRFLQHDTYTDIITFDISESEDHISGEIYISTDRVKENAVQFRTDYNNELHRVIFHGWLHLLGYKDKTTDEAALMRAMEAQHLNQYLK